MTNTINDPLLNELVTELIKKHRCHTVILYGSRARGDFTSQSDYDLLGIRKTGKNRRLAEKRNGFYTDIFIYPEKDLTKVGEEHLYMKGAKVLFEEDTFGTSFIKKLKAAQKKKYRPLSDDEIQMRRVWLHKMFDRSLKQDIEGNYRRSWLHEALLNEYFNIRKKRYAGSKQGFAWLQKYDKKTYALFNRVLKNPADMASLKKLVEQVSLLEND